jgi:hypothetical protein
METLGFVIVIAMLAGGIAGLIADHQDVKRLQKIDLKLAQRFDPPPTYVSAEFLSDEEIGRQNLG